MLNFEQFEFVATGTTADPSASLGMTKGRAVRALAFAWEQRGTAGPSTALRSGRDDTSICRIEVVPMGGWWS
jgi:hypothetical protein